MARIINRGRGPEIEGTRITVYDVMDYRGHWEADKIAALFKLPVDAIRLALDYISDHEVEVSADYQKILDRHAKGNPPELQAKLDVLFAAFMARVAERRRAKGETLPAEEVRHAGYSG